MCPECFEKLIDNIWLITKDLEAKLGKGENLGSFNVNITTADISDVSADTVIGRIILIDKVMNRPSDLAIEINGEFLEVTGIEDKGYLSEAIKQKFFPSGKFSYIRGAILEVIKDQKKRKLNLHGLLLQIII